ncbi:hypothetical protein Tco_0682798 [Tanacetum coccineum]|uniref:Uncharacterized protein n=1 Tax=Tanacetum coccineum TaxID=301880 RepID=A0ABQ4XS71_9ASTR
MCGEGIYTHIRWTWALFTWVFHGPVDVYYEFRIPNRNNQQEWETVIHMLVERRYPLSKELLQRMLDMGLEVEKESAAALHLVRFIKQQLNKE